MSGYALQTQEELLARVARESRERYYGKYRGFVADNRDPETRGRLRLRIPTVLGDEVSGWALPCVPYGGRPGQGSFFVPDIDAQVWVEFEEGDLSKPVWVGTFWQQSADVPAEAALAEPTTRLLRTASGHTLQFDDEEGKERIHLAHPEEASIEIDPQGTMTLIAANGSTVVLDAAAGEVVIDDAGGNKMTMRSTGTTVEDSNGNRIEMGPAGVTVKGQQVVVQADRVALGGEGGEPVIKGTSFLSLFATHVHPTGVGPSGPPVPQGEMSALSAKVTSA